MYFLLFTKHKRNFLTHEHNSVKFRIQIHVDINDCATNLKKRICPIDLSAINQKFLPKIRHSFFRCYCCVYSEVNSSSSKTLFLMSFWLFVRFCVCVCVDDSLCYIYFTYTDVILCQVVPSFSSFQLPYI